VTALLLAMAGAGVGAPLRYLTDRTVQSRRDSVFPWGTFIVNVAGSLLLGIVMGATTDPTTRTLLAVGFCGGLTTYSTFSFETLRLAEDGSRILAAVNVVASVLAGLVAVTLGLWVGRTIPL